MSKLFLAYDQNTYDDDKLTVGYGMEQASYFWSLSLSKALSGSRRVGSELDVFQQTLGGVEGGREYIQTETTRVLTEYFNHAYEYGAGVRIGRWFDNELLRVQGGLDYEDGKEGTHQFTASVSLEKYVANTGHSFGLTLEAVNKAGEYELDDGDFRALLQYRYAFGTTHRPSYNAVERPVERVIEPRAEVVEKRLVKHRVNISQEALFGLNQSILEQQGMEAMKALSNYLQTHELASAIELIGHTCDLGTEAYNQALSVRRANAVKRLLTENVNGIDPNSINVRGAGELSPAYPNDSEANRRRNRRVSIEFFSLEEREEDVVIEPAVEGGVQTDWVREEITDPAWIQRALRNPARHKRRVDYYRTAKISTQVELGERVFLNASPSAIDDTFEVKRNSQANVLNVLSNDSDADGDALTITSVSGESGSITISGDTLLYTPPAGFVGVETFTYEVSDGEVTATGTVKVTVTAPLLQPADDALQTRRNQSAGVDVLANDTADLSLTVTSVSSPANGSAVVSGGRISYTPNRDYVGQDSFTYTVTDEEGTSATATVSVDVAAYNRAPVAGDDERSTTGNAPLTIDVLANDSDPDGDALRVISISTTDTGNDKVTLLSDGRIRYVSHPGFCGDDTFEYTVADDFGGETTATVLVHVLD